jgi:hypothetical protein
MKDVLELIKMPRSNWRDLLSSVNRYQLSFRDGISAKDRGILLLPVGEKLEDFSFLNLHSNAYLLASPSLNVGICCTSNVIKGLDFYYIFYFV